MSIVASTKRPPDDRYYEDTWSSVYFQGDLFHNVPLAFPWPPDLVLAGEEGSERRFLSGPFETTHAMLVTPTCTMAAQGRTAPVDGYAMPARTLVPVRPLAEVVAAGAVSDETVGHLRRDRLRNYFYLPPHEEWDFPESVALLYQPTTVHHNVLNDLRIGQLRGEGFWQLRRSLAFYDAGIRITTEDLGKPPGPRERMS